MTGTNGNDTISGVWDTTHGSTSSSYNSGDVLNGGAGTDTLFVNVVGADTANTNAPSSAGIITQGVEILKISNSGTGTGVATLDASTMQGLTSVQINTSIATGDTTVAGLQNIVEASMANGSGDLTLTYGTSVVNGTADTQKLALNGQTAGTFTANGMETIAVTTSGTASKVTLASDVIKTVTVDGSANLNLTTSAKTVNAAALTGALTLANTTAAASITGGSGNDTIKLGALDTSMKIDGGAGTDTVSITGTSLSTAEAAVLKNVESLAFAGTSLTLADASVVSGLTSVGTAITKADSDVSSAAFTATAGSYTATVNGKTYTEAYAVSTDATLTALVAKINADYAGLATADTTNDKVTFNLSTWTGAPIAIGALTENAGTAVALAAIDAEASGSVSISKLASGATVNLESQNLVREGQVDATDAHALNKLGGTVALSVNNASTGTADSLTVNLNNNATMNQGSFTKVLDNKFEVTVLTANDIESLTINSTGTFGKNVITSLTADAAKTITVTGDQAVTITAMDLAGSGTGAVAVNASALTNKFTGTFIAEAADYTITGSAKDDTVTIANFNDVDVVDLGEGTDTLNITLGNVDAGNINVKNTETIALTTGGTDAVDFRNVTGAKLVSIAAGGAHSTTIDRLQAGTDVRIASNTGLTAAALDVDTGITSLNVALGKDATTATGNGTDGDVTTLTIDSGVTTLNLTADGAGGATSGSDQSITVGTLNATGATNLTINASNDTGAIAFTTVNATKLVNLTITGGVADATATSDTLNFGILAGATALTSINASGADVGIDLSGLAVFKDAATITLGNGIDSLKWDVTKAKSAVLDGGAGSDTLFLAGTQNVGQSVVDLSSTTDQVTQTNGEVNTAVQKNFENVNASNLSGSGATITGSSGANTIVGTGSADVITGGLGADIITGGAGTDVIDLTEASGTAADTVIFADASSDIVKGFSSAGTDLVQLNATAAGLGLTNGSSTNAYLEITTAAADAAAASGANDTVVELTQAVSTAAGTAIDAYQANQNATTLQAMINAIVGSTGGGQAFDGGLNAVFDDAGDKVVFVVHSATDSVALLYTAGAGGGTADTTLEAGEVSIIGVFDSAAVALANLSSV